MRHPLRVHQKSPAVSGYPLREALVRLDFYSWSRYPNTPKCNGVLHNEWRSHNSPVSEATLDSPRLCRGYEDDERSVILRSKSLFALLVDVGILYERQSGNVQTSENAWLTLVTSSLPSNLKGPLSPSSYSILQFVSKSFVCRAGDS